MDFFAPSLLDKLLAADLPAADRGTTLRMDAEQVKESVGRDIETLLNARPSLEADAVGHLPRVARSLLRFGLMDLASLSLASDRDRMRITEAMRRALADHEPRLAQVEVTVDESAAFGGGLRFTIRAALRLAPMAEPVAFDAVLQPGSQRYAVSRSRPRAAPAV